MFLLQPRLSNSCDPWLEHKTFGASSVSLHCCSQTRCNLDLMHFLNTSKLPTLLALTFFTFNMRKIMRSINFIVIEVDNLSQEIQLTLKLARQSFYLFVQTARIVPFKMYFNLIICICHIEYLGLKDKIESSVL